MLDKSWFPDSMDEEKLVLGEGSVIIDVDADVLARSAEGVLCITATGSTFDIVGTNLAIVKLVRKGGPLEVRDIVV